MALYEVDVIGNADGLVGFISKTEFGTIPTREHENSGEDPICILDELVEHLADGHICVVMEVGSEKSCYVTGNAFAIRSEEHTSELQSLMRISYAVFCLKKNNIQTPQITS